MITRRQAKDAVNERAGQSNDAANQTLRPREGHIEKGISENRINKALLHKAVHRGSE
jgi:hypothetical protein